MDDEHLIYKYYSSDRIDVLRNLEVRFTPLAELNDPFDGRFQFGAREDEQEAAVADNYRSEAAQVEVYVRITLGVLGAFCLSKECASEVMWAHYAKEHRGFVIGLNRRVQPFGGSAFIWSDYRTKIDLTSMEGFGSLRDIDYCDTPYSIPFGGPVPFDALFRKKTRWTYEQEVRIFRSIYDADRTVGTGIHLFAIPPEALAVILLGANVDPAIESTARALRARPDLSHVSFRRAVLDPRQQTISFVDLEDP